MKMKKTVLGAAIATVMGFSAMGAAQAAAVANGDVLSLTQGVQATSSSVVTSQTGSYFAMDFNTDSKIAYGEMTQIGQGTTGLVIGVAGSPGAFHAGAPTAGDSNAIDAAWFFSSNTGSHWTSIGITGDTTTGLDFSGWNVAWSSLSAIPMTGGAWDATSGKGYIGATTDGVAVFQWDGTDGGAYTLDYHATVPVGDPSNFGGIQYELHLEGFVTTAAVPVPAAVWLFGSGLLGLVGVARRKIRQV
jgi:hypothetical protein